MTMAIQQKVIDPVCGMEVDPDHAAGESEYAGQTYHFCSAGCKTRFDAEPEVWHAAAQAQAHGAKRPRAALPIAPAPAAPVQLTRTPPPAPSMEADAAAER